MDNISPAFMDNMNMVESNLANLAAVSSTLSQDSSPESIMRFNMTSSECTQYLAQLSTEVDRLEVDESSSNGAETFAQVVTGSADRLLAAEVGVLEALGSGAGDNGGPVKESVTKLHTEIQSVVEKLRAKKTTKSTHIPGIDQQLARAYEDALAALG